MRTTPATPRDLAIIPTPPPEVAAAIVAALHAHRRRAALMRTSIDDASASGWLAAGRRGALGADWPHRRAGGWRAHP